MKTAVLLPNWIGDVVMATPTLRALHKSFGQESKLVGIMRPYVAEVLAGTPWLGQQLFYDPHSRDPRLGSRALVRRLRELNLENIVVLPNSLRTGVIAWFSGAGRRIGYHRFGRGAMLTEKLMPPRDGWRLTPISAVDYFLGLAYQMGCPEEPKRVELATTNEDDQKANHIWKKYDLQGRDTVVALCLGGAYGPAKHWPTDSYVQLSRQVISDLKAAVLVVCGPGEAEYAQEISKRVADPNLVSLGREKMSIGLSKACIKRSQVVVSTDSGPRHIAAAFERNSIALFGPTDPRWSVNYHPNEMWLQEEVPCGPCGKRVCPLEHHACMRQLSVTRVFEAIEAQLNNHRAAA